MALTTVETTDALRDAVRALVNPSYASVDTVLLDGVTFVVASVGPYTLRFAVPPGERMWVSECRNEIADPPGAWDEYADGPLESAERSIIANWIANCITDEV